MVIVGLVIGESRITIVEIIASDFVYTIQDFMSLRVSDSCVIACYVAFCLLQYFVVSYMLLSLLKCHFTDILVGRYHSL
jgi:hypothetical protein